MIRDPSDGSVREPKKSEVGNLATKPDFSESDTGLPPVRKRAEQLQKSREWVKDYFAKRGEKHAISDTQS